MIALCVPQRGARVKGRDSIAARVRGAHLDDSDGSPLRFAGIYAHTKTKLELLHAYVECIEGVRGTSLPSRQDERTRCARRPGLPFSSGMMAAQSACVVTRVPPLAFDHPDRKRIGLHGKPRQLGVLGHCFCVVDPAKKCRIASTGIWHLLDTSSPNAAIPVR